MASSISDLVNKGFKPIDWDKSVYFSLKRELLLYLVLRNFMKEKLPNNKRKSILVLLLEL